MSWGHHARKLEQQRRRREERGVAWMIVHGPESPSARQRRQARANTRNTPPMVSRKQGSLSGFLPGCLIWCAAVGLAVAWRRVQGTG